MRVAGLIAIVGALVLAGPAAADSPRITHTWVREPFVTGERGTLWVKATAPGREVIALDVDFGDGRREVVGRSCQSGAPPSGRGRFADFPHRYEQTGVFTITIRAIATESCGSSAALEAGPGRTTRVRAFPALVTVPRLIGIRPLDATCTLRRRGLRWRDPRVGPKPFYEPCATLRNFPGIPGSGVSSQHPPPGTKVRPGTVVRLDECPRALFKLRRATSCAVQ